MLKRMFTASVLVVLVHLMASGADAFTSDKRTYFTFNQSVALPGVTLPAGTYMFRLADPDTSRRVIQVSDKDGTQSYALLLTMPAYRVDAAKDSEIRFLETAAGAPRAINAWWYVGDNTGYQFIYSKKQLAELNRVGQPEPVAAAVEESPGLAEGEPVVPPIADANQPDIVEGNGVPAEASVEESAVAADIEEPEVEQQAQAQPPAQQPPFENAPPAAQDRSQLPQTASPLALILLTGLASGGLGLRLFRK
ncbi:MAG TPA: hypothetical protein VKA59_04770 [Vicinamibacterales bacterium]|jgi:hypothetical protein|nr:hypothetical protein [Vicinamibacterales bacterium]